MYSHALITDYWNRLYLPRYGLEWTFYLGWVEEGGGGGRAQINSLGVIQILYSNTSSAARVPILF